MIKIYELFNIDIPNVDISNVSPSILIDAFAAVLFIKKIKTESIKAFNNSNPNLYIILSLSYILSL